MALTDALLPLLERITAETWECPFFQVRFDMSWTNCVLTANGRCGLPEPLQSRCVVLDLPDLTTGELVSYAKRQGQSRGLSDPALSALEEAIDRAGFAGQTLCLRTVNRMLDRAEHLAKQPVLH